MVCEKADRVFILLLHNIMFILWIYNLGVVFRSTLYTVRGSNRLWKKKNV